MRRRVGGAQFPTPRPTFICQAANDELSVRYTLSLGLLTIIPDQNTEWDTLYILCDKALYEAKNKGRNQVVHYQYSRESKNPARL
ncbi:diguanylate cyclase domain-containing protein [Schinkia azotoformans]|uniref:diguanylate cyclase domain-containing protein n=1 Tax=Schinkia azotoformans TaxID=1454 RepID=UPI0012F773BD